MIVMAIESAFYTGLQLDLSVRLPFFGDDVDQAAGAAAAIQRGSPVIIR
jgi:hypothetical protein